MCVCTLVAEMNVNSNTSAFRSQAASFWLAAFCVFFCYGFVVVMRYLIQALPCQRLHSNNIRQ